MTDHEIVQEFLVESGENLSRLDQDVLELESRPDDKALISSVFRTIHTIKGTCGFLGFTRLEKISHVTENILSELRDGKRRIDAGLASLILKAADAIRKILASIEAGSGEGEGEVFETGLLEELARARNEANAGAAPPPPSPSPAPEVAAVPQPAPPMAPAAAAQPPGSPLAPALAAETPAPPLAPAPGAETPAPPVAPAPAEPPAPAAAPAATPQPPARAAALAAAPQPPGPAAAPAAAPQPPAPATALAAEQAETRAAAQTLRVDVGLLDRLMNLVGELVLTRNQVLQSVAAHEDSELNGISQRLNLITSELQEGVMKTRMQPIGRIFNQLPRVVRDLAQSLHKQVALEVEGADTELDRTIIEAIKDPLTHIVRNACDHGIEGPEERVRCGKAPKGRLFIRAFHEGGQVNIEIADDGAGIDPARIRAKAVERGTLTAAQAGRLSEHDAVQLIFLPGFSTAKTVTNVSGRGVGMDVVRTHIERIGGTVDLHSRPGAGTSLRVKIPLTLAIIPGLVVYAGGERFIIPQVSLHELIRLEGEAAGIGIEYVHSTPVLRRREALLPLTDLSETLGLPKQRNAGEVNIVVLQVEQRRFGLVVDSIGDTQEIVVKPLWQHLKTLNCYAGATIMGDGRIGLILDVAGIGNRAGVIRAAPEAESEVARESAAHVSEARKSLLLLRAGTFRRLAMPLGRVARLENIPAAHLEHAAGRAVVQYRGRVMPLVWLADVLGGGPAEQPETLQAVVYRDGETDVGLVVDEILDVVEETVHSPFASDRAGLLGSAIVGGSITDFLDLDVVAQWASLPSSASLARLESAIAGEQCRVCEEALQ